MSICLTGGIYANGSSGNDPLTLVLLYLPTDAWDRIWPGQSQSQGKTYPSNHPRWGTLDPALGGTLVHELRPHHCSAQPSSSSPPPPHQMAAATMSRGSSTSVFLGVDVGTGSARAGSISDSLFFDPLFYLPFLFFSCKDSSLFPKLGNSRYLVKLSVG